jgi:hypothetical protein
MQRACPLHPAQVGYKQLINWSLLLVKLTIMLLISFFAVDFRTATTKIVQLKTLQSFRTM